MTTVSGGASLFTGGGGSRSNVIVDLWLAGTAMGLRIPTLSCIAVVVDGI